MQQKLLDKDSSPPADPQLAYAGQLAGKIAEAIILAHQQLKVVDVSVGVAEQQVPISFNRRFVMKDGSVQTWKNLKDPNVVRAAGPIDSEVSVLAIKTQARGDTAAQTLGVLSNFALHLDTVGGMRWSAD